MLTVNQILDVGRMLDQTGGRDRPEVSPEAVIRTVDNQRKGMRLMLYYYILPSGCLVTEPVWEKDEEEPKEETGQAEGV